MRPLLSLLLVLVVVAVGCSPSQPSTPAGEDAGVEAPAAGGEPEPSAGQLKVGVMPKLIGIPFFNAAQKGAEEAGKELGVEFTYDGPVVSDVTTQAQMVDSWIAQRYDAIAVAPNDPDAIASVLDRAKRRGVKVITWDADSKPEVRDFFVNQCTAESVARTLVDVMVEGIGPEGKYIIITGSLTAANQNIWMEEMEKYRQEKYPNLENLSPTPKAPGEDKAMATQVTIDSLKAYPDLNGIFAITSVALPGAAEALRKTGAADRVFLTGLATPNDMREYVKDGTVKKFVLWDVVNLGYLTTHVAVASAKGELQPGATTFTAGRVGEVEVVGQEVILGDPLVFDSGNIDNYDF